MSIEHMTRKTQIKAENTSISFNINWKGTGTEENYEEFHLTLSGAAETSS